MFEDERRKRIEKEARDEEDKRRKAETKLKFENEKAEFMSAVESFQRLNVGFKGSIPIASEHDVRAEWSKIQAEFKSLKCKMAETVGIDHNEDSTDIKQKFTDEAEKEFIEVQKVVLERLKDTSGGKASSSSSSRGDSVKKEAVKLPMFQGSEKSSPFLKFPVWKQRWETLIVG